MSPQRVTHYRDNWYLDAWDHDREALRSFAVDRIAAAQAARRRRRATSRDAELDEHLASSYGIFSGPPKGWATIVFSAKAARWVADEHWHSQQQGRFLPDGRYELKVPYSNSRELLMDVLHYGSDAEIVEPPALREQARALLSLAMLQLRAHDGRADAPKIRSGEKVALVLGAGGARGLAQIGVIEALEARGMNIVAIAGSSSGALVGGLHAAGKLREYPRLAAAPGSPRDAAPARSGLRALGVVRRHSA